MAQTSVVRGRATTVARSGEDLAVTYHSTMVVERRGGVITLRTGGWKSSTTKVRMNQASRQFSLGYTVFQKNHRWFVDYSGKTLPFDAEEIVLS